MGTSNRHTKSNLLKVVITALLAMAFVAVPALAFADGQAVANKQVAAESIVNATAASESEQEEIDTSSIVAGKVIFSIRDYRNDENAQFSDWLRVNAICFKYGLSDVELVIETHADADDDEGAAGQTGKAAFDVFFEANTSISDIADLVERMNDSGDVLMAEPDYIWNTAEVGDYQLSTTDISSMPIATTSTEKANCANWYESMKVEDAWKKGNAWWKKQYQEENPEAELDEDDYIEPGQGVVVAVIDTGVDYTHVDLKDNIWVNADEIPGDGIDNDGNGYVDDVYGYNFIANNGNPMDDNGHGTHVSGIIAMEAGNDGGVGLAYGAKIMCVKAAQANGTLAASDIAKAIKYAAANGADVINMSFAGTSKSFLVEEALEDAFATCVLVAAAGNDAKTTTDCPYYDIPKADYFPAGYNYVIGVMATGMPDENGNATIASFSNWDWVGNSWTEYELAAPGVSIYSTFPGDKYATWSGTSMAAPMVSAAAAIIRGSYIDKTEYPSRFIMGQLTSATTCKAYLMYPVYREYANLNLEQSLTSSPKPNLTITDINLFDGKDISNANNADGVVQAGETIDVGVVIRNQWGAAKDCEVTLAADVNGIDSQYIEIIDGDIEFPEVGTFASWDNGYTKTGDVITGVSNPLRFKVKDNAPNDVQVTLKIRVTGKNALDGSDGTIYGELYYYVYTFIIQNGYELKGTISENMTLTADKLWIINSAVTIAEGVTVNVDPGTQIQFYGGNNGGIYDKGAYACLYVEGDIYFNGTEEYPINIYLGKGYENKAVLIMKKGDNVDVGGMKYSTSSTNKINMSYCRIDNPCMHINAGDHLYLQQTNPEVLIPFYDNASIKYSKDNGCCLVADTLSNSILRWFRSHGGRATTEYNGISMRGSIDVKKMSSCIVYDSTMEILTGSAYKNWRSFGHVDEIKGCVFLGAYEYFWNENRNPGLILSADAFSGNAILNPNDPSKWVAISCILKASSAPESNATCDATGNFWGTDSENLIDIMITDSADNPVLNTIDYSNYLTLESHELESIYPFVTQAYITDTQGQALESAAPGQTIQIHVKFNRDMALDVNPMVSFGGEEPYTDYLVSGDWVKASNEVTSSREWVGTIKIQQWISQGTQWIRVKDAAAASDKWLLTGTDEARFSFDVVKTSAQSMTLQGAGAAGKNALSWAQDDYETLAGYNLYRSKNYDATQPLTSQYFTKVNTTILTENAYDDAAVEEGVDYYYYFTVVDTAFSESGPSNVICATPLDTEVPVIQHTQVSSITQGSEVTVKATVTDNVSVESVTLYYRKQGAQTWSTASMNNTAGNNYQAKISAFEMSIGTMEYYIVASDGTSETLAGSATNPYTFGVTDPVAVQSVSLNTAKASIDVGATLQLSATVNPSNVTVANLTWSSSDIAVATVSQAGLVSAQSPGKATITVKSGNGKTATCEVTVRTPSSTTVSIASVTAQPGETIDVPVSIAGNCGISAMILNIHYDANVLQPAGIAKGTLLKDASLEAGIPSAGVYRTIWYFNEDIASDGELFVLQMKVLEGATLNNKTTISATYTDGDICNVNHDEPSVSIVSGGITVQMPLLGDIYEDGVLNSHDITDLLQYLVGKKTLTPHQLIAANINNQDEVVDMKDIVKLAQVIINTPSLSSVRSLSSVSAGPALSSVQSVSPTSSVSVQTDQQDFEISVGSAVIESTGDVSIPVSFSGCPGVAGYRLDINYDASLLQLNSITKHASTGSMTTNLDTSVPGKARVVWYSASDAVLQGEQFTLNFTVLTQLTTDGAEISLSASANDICNANMENVDVTLESGKISGTIAPTEVVFDLTGIADPGTVIYIDGVARQMNVVGKTGTVVLDTAGAKIATLYTYNVAQNVLGSADTHTVYPTHMYVWTLAVSEGGGYVATRQVGLDDILKYAGTSIRLTGNKGIRTITALPTAVKSALVSDAGYQGWKLVEYGTAIQFDSAFAGQEVKDVLLSNTSYKNYAYKSGVADPIYAQDAALTKYTNVLVGFTNEQCAKDLSMRPYIVLKDMATDEAVTIYGGTVHRSIGYVALQNKDKFAETTDAGAFIWGIIRSVYGNAYN